jgi:hypothetical protein
MREEEVLFQTIDLGSLFESKEKTARNAVSQLPSADVLNALDHLGLCENILEPLKVTVPNLSEPEDPRPFDDELEVSDGFNGSVRVVRHFAELVIPFVGGSKFGHRRNGRPIHTTRMPSQDRIALVCPKCGRSGEATISEQCQPISGAPLLCGAHNFSRV